MDLLRSRLVPPPKKNKAVTLRDVAKLAGVSHVAVSIALHGGSSRKRVSDETRQRIQEVARQLGYQPNAIARSLVSSRSRAIGLYGSRWFLTDSPWTATIFAGLQLGCADYGLDLVIHGTYADRDGDGKAEFVYGQLADGKIDGLMVYTDPADPVLERLRASRLALVSLPHELPGIPSVVDDTPGGMRELARHLYARGHRRAIFRDLSEAISTRRVAFQAEADALGLEVHHTAFDYSNPDGFRADEEALLALDRADRATVVVGAFDGLVVPVLHECRRRGWRIPEDLAVAGYDGVSLLYEQPTRWRLTTIRVDWRRAAQLTVGRLVEVLDRRVVPGCTLVPSTLVVGDTT